MSGIDEAIRPMLLAITPRPSGESRSRRTETVVMIALCGVIASTSASGHVHVAPDGTATAWYPRECCHDGDCRPVAQVRSSDQGLWITTEDGITVLASRAQAHRPSYDARWHVCVSFDELNQPVVLCIFEPGSS
jgi:hypothetical protein